MNDLINKGLLVMLALYCAVMPMVFVYIIAGIIHG